MSNANHFESHRMRMLVCEAWFAWHHLRPVILVIFDRCCRRCTQVKLSQHCLLSNLFVALLVLDLLLCVGIAAGNQKDKFYRDKINTESMSDFIRANPECLEFNDQCSFCTVVDGQVDCSTPQIASIKKQYQCTRFTPKKIGFTNEIGRKTTIR